MSYQDVKNKLYHGHRKIANNTYITLGNEGVRVDVREPPSIKLLSEHINMRLHGYLVARFYLEYLELHSAGWYITTTKNRLNLALDLAGISGKVYQRDWQWYYAPLGCLDIEFENGMKIAYNGGTLTCPYMGVSDE